MHTDKLIKQRNFSLPRLALVPMVVAAALLAGCGDDKADTKTASQAAARVDGEELTVHQINLVLERQPGLRPEQADAASRQVLEGLIDQQIAVEKAVEGKLDRDPKIVQLLDAQRRATLVLMRHRHLRIQHWLHWSAPSRLLDLLRPPLKAMATLITSHFCI